MTALMSYALACASRGWHVFPLAPGGKRPAIKQWEQRATTDPDRIRRCWGTGGYNIGIATGPSNLVVVDLDIPKQATLDGDTIEATGADNFTELAARPRPAGPSRHVLRRHRQRRHAPLLRPPSHRTGLPQHQREARAASRYPRSRRIRRRARLPHHR